MQKGCINADNKLVEDATADEINAAVSGVAASSVAATTAAAATWVFFGVFSNHSTEPYHL